MCHTRLGLLVPGFATLVTLLWQDTFWRLAIPITTEFDAWSNVKLTPLLVCHASVRFVVIMSTKFVTSDCVMSNPLFICHTGAGLRVISTIEVVASWYVKLAPLLICHARVALVVIVITEIVATFEFLLVKLIPTFYIFQALTSRIVPWIVFLEAVPSRVRWRKFFCQVCGWRGDQRIFILFGCPCETCKSKNNLEQILFHMKTYLFI
jgi:hypothetical protein